MYGSTLTKHAHTYFKMFPQVIMLSPHLHQPRRESGTAAASFSPLWFSHILVFKCFDSVHGPIHSPTVTFVRGENINLRPKKVICIADTIVVVKNQMHLFCCDG